MLTRKQIHAIFVSEETSMEKVSKQQGRIRRIATEGRNSMNSKLLQQFAEFLEKQDLLSKLTEKEQLHAYGYSEVHTIAAIGDMEMPNVTAIARHLKMTRGAISKITKRLLKAGVIESYAISGNRQKVFFRLTETGWELYEDHAKRHQMWIDRDNEFLNQFTEEQLTEISKFMESFNGYLEEKIKEVGGK